MGKIKKLILIWNRKNVKKNTWFLIKRKTISGLNTKYEEENGNWC